MKILKEILFLLFLLLLVYSCRQSTEGFPGETPKGAVSGIVYEQTSHFPIPGATVLVLYSQQQTVTDSSGCFFLGHIASGENSIVISKAGYVSDTMAITVPESDTLHIEITLTPNSQFWTQPEDDASILFFRLFDVIRLDSALAGKIQYRLNLARTVDSTLDTIHAMPDWEFGALLMEVTDSVFQLIDFDHKRFNCPPIDSLLLYFHLQNFHELPSVDGHHWLHLNFPHDYNMPMVGKAFETINGIIHATANYTGVFPEGPPFDINLIIDGMLYKFRFYLNLNFYPGANYHYWEVHVLDNRIVFVQKK